MSETIYSYMIPAATGIMLLTAVAQVWRRSLIPCIHMLAIQGGALAIMVAAVGVYHGHPETVAVSLLVFAVKAIALPQALLQARKMTGATHEQTPLLSPAPALLATIGLTVLAYLVSEPLLDAFKNDVVARVLPIGLAMFLLGYLIMLSRRRALSQLIGFVVIDNGITTVSVLVSGGLPIVTEIGVILDVFAVVLILRVLAIRMLRTFGDTNTAKLRELHD